MARSPFQKTVIGGSDRINCYGAFMETELKVDTEQTTANPERKDIDYPEALLRVWRLVDNESSRYALAFVRVDFPNRFVEATNGRILVRETFEIEVDEDFCWYEETVLFLGEDLKRIALLFDKPGKRLGLKLVKIGKEWFAENAEMRLRINTNDSRFPDTDSILRIKPLRSAKFTVDMKELRKFLNAFGSVDSGGHTGVEISVPLDNNSLLSLSCGCGSVKARLSLMSNVDNRSQTVVIEPAFESP